MTTSKSVEEGPQEWPQELDWGANWQGRYKWCPWKGPGANGGDGQSYTNRQNACRERRVQSRAKIPELELKKWELEQEVAQLGKSVIGGAAGTANPAIHAMPGPGFTSPSPGLASPSPGRPNGEMGHGGGGCQENG